MRCQTASGKSWNSYNGGDFVFLIAAVVVSFLVALFTQQLTNNVGMILFILVLYGLVGFLDDFLKVFRKINEGLNPKQKLALQLLGGVIFYLFYERGGDMLSVFGYQVHLGIFYILFALFWLVGFSNAVNLTDGIDGLASISVVISLSAYGVICLCARSDGYSSGDSSHDWWLARLLRL